MDGEPGGNRTHNPQIKSRLRYAKTFEIRMILQGRCAERAIPKQIDATQTQPTIGFHHGACGPYAYDPWRGRVGWVRLMAAVVRLH